MERWVVLITGSNGLVGSSFIESIAGNGRFTLVCPSHEQMDVSDQESVKNVMNKYQPNAIINFAAHRNANTAEDQKGDYKSSAWMTNVLGARYLAEMATKYQAHLVHVSTDMVFSGKKENQGPYVEGDTPENNPEDLSWYGYTKRRAENEIHLNTHHASIVRIGNVTKPTQDPHLDYIGKILWLYDQDCSIFENQFITLTHLGQLSLAILKLIEGEMSGIFHVASNDLVTPFQLAEYLVQKIRPGGREVKPSSIDDYLEKHPNRYLKFGGLKDQDTRSWLGMKPMSWREMADDFINKAT